MGNRILLISGSTRPGSTDTAALRTLAESVGPDIEATLFTGLVETPAFVPGCEPSPPTVAALRDRLAAADAVIFCTPEYAGMIPGALKNLLEWTVGTADLHEKPVAWISVAAVHPDMVGADETITDASVRAALAESAATIGAYLSASPSSQEL